MRKDLKDNMTTEECNLLKLLEKEKYDYMYRNEKGQLIALREKDNKIVLIDSNYFSIVTEPCPIYIIKKAMKYGTNVDIETLEFWLQLLTTGRVETVINILKHRVKK